MKQKKVVVLIEEYDKPIISNLQNDELSDIQKKLGSFYEILKGNDDYIKFIFVTGISKITHVSVFSKLNNLNDLTLLDEFNSICGYTQEELEDSFPDYIENSNTIFNYMLYFFDGIISKYKNVDLNKIPSVKIWTVPSIPVHR
ncbi:MAG: AAA family ATPase [Methanobrevibacter sp.]|nr:AAA family ATPase [Candidatus Methanovirga basalitermitum]